MSTVMPVVFYKEPVEAIDWLGRAFGFELGLMVTDNEGRLGHAEVRWRDEPIGVGAEWASAELLGPASLKSPTSLEGAGSQFIRLFLEKDIDLHCERARAAGARIVQEPQTQFYGDRTYRALDPEGHVWNFSQTVQALSIAEMEKASGLTFTSGDRT